MLMMSGHRQLSFVRTEVGPPSVEALVAGEVVQAAL